MSKIDFKWNNVSYLVDESAKSFDYIQLPDGIYLKVLEWNGLNPVKIMYTEKAPPGWEGTIMAMKKHPELSKGKTKDGKDKNVFALAWHMKNQGDEAHYKDSKSDKPKKKKKYKNESFGEWFNLREMAARANMIPKPVKNQVTNEISASKFPTYWPKPGQAITELSHILGRYEIAISDIISFNDSLESYRQAYSLEYQGQPVDNRLVFSWFRMPSGKFEITSYIS